MIGLHLRAPYVIRVASPAVTRVVRIGYEYGEEVEGQKYIGSHRDQNGVAWALWDSCSSVASLVDCDYETRFRASQSDYADATLEFLDDPIPIAYSASSREDLVGKITSFASEPQPLKSGPPSSGEPGDTTRPPKLASTTKIPKATPGYVSTKPPAKLPLTAKAPAPDGSLVLFVLLGALGAGLIAMKLLA